MLKRTFAKNVYSPLAGRRSGILLATTRRYSILPAYSNRVSNGKKVWCRSTRFLIQPDFSRVSDGSIRQRSCRKSRQREVVSYTLFSIIFCDHKASAAAAREPASESDWSLSAWSAFFQVHPKSAPGFRYRSTFVSRKLHPSRSVPPTPQRPEE